MTVEVEIVFASSVPPLLVSFAWRRIVSPKDLEVTVWWHASCARLAHRVCRRGSGLVEQRAERPPQPKWFVPPAGKGTRPASTSVARARSTARPRTRARTL